MSIYEELKRRGFPEYETADFETLCNSVCCAGPGANYDAAITAFERSDRSDPVPCIAVIRDDGSDVAKLIEDAIAEWNKHYKGAAKLPQA